MSASESSEAGCHFIVFPLGMLLLQDLLRVFRFFGGSCYNGLEAECKTLESGATKARLFFLDMLASFASPTLLVSLCKVIHALNPQSHT